MRCVWTKHTCPKCKKHYEQKQEICDCGYVLRCKKTPIVGLAFCATHSGGKNETRGIRNISPNPVIHSQSRLLREASRMATDQPIKKANTFKSEELARRYEELINDPELVALRKPLALINARVLQLLDRVEDGVTNNLWEQAIEVYADLKKAYMTSDEGEVQKNIVILDGIFKRVEDDYKSWAQVFDAIELQRKLSESERKRLIEMKQFITAEEAMEMVKKLTAAIYKNVQDPLTLRKIIYEFTRVTGSSPRDYNTGFGDEGQQE